MAKGPDYISDVKRFSGWWWWARMRSVFWVTVVTALVWVYADMEISESREFVVAIRLVAGRANRVVVRETNGQPLSITFLANGSRRSLDQFGRWLWENPRPITCDLTSYDLGGHEIPVTELLNQAPDIVQRGLTVQQTTPDRIAFRIDALLTRELAVTLDVTGGLADQVQIDPAKVTVTAAQSAWEHIDQAGDEPVIKTVRQDLSKYAAGQPVTISVPLVAGIADQSVQVDPKTVSVTLTVSQLTETKTFSIIVRLLHPVEWAADTTWREYELQRQDPLAWRMDITITGAKKDLDQLRPEDVHAFVELTEADKQPVDSWLDRAVRIRLPEGLQLRLVGQPPSVKFKLVKRTDAPATP